MEGVPVPQSQILRPGDQLMPLPVIIKPVEEDNSQGITLVHCDAEIPEALSHAFKFGRQVLCEQFIPLGREPRVAVVERGDGHVEMLPVIECFLTEQSPIRKPEDKYKTNKDGKPVAHATADPVCPAEADDTLKEKLFQASTRAHNNLGCTDYSIFDFRIDPSGEPYMLESCLYCSFAPKSVFVIMQASAGTHPTELFTRLCERAIACSRRTKFGQKTGMK